ncbi:hypothetical protein HUA74_04705 [Myxococcus sp. CA051A]|uniref:hypothetical protein n=1 Tax=unclassified Myxococcus TaxID=2648731 RepID=UPI00157B9A6D|nr:MULTISPECIES: hypothetical protein [unclassified Myxococcus]NTX01327.1 hypothetical protein [Myxococcus sp. CA040A]NTX15647.1 hypothetical protein [Myxococcus sp. CA056]NTX32982.1 hypothetical protein [Myxococcus sp. CA033]NTX57401.1 hypothetical protein [Myxococcus sp. CA039A]NTX59954.1 hypothetical protein [Myxococcus sp. CA051A]
MLNSNSGKTSAGLVAQEIPDPPPEKDRGLRAPTGEEATPVFSARLSLPPPPPADEPAANDER